MASKYIAFYDSSVHYTISGKGMPVVLLHGFAEDGTIWKNQLPFLEKNYTVIVPDIPGSGKSSRLKGESIRIEDYANCI